jgi:hypothetical protein
LKFHIFIIYPSPDILPEYDHFHFSYKIYVISQTTSTLRIVLFRCGDAHVQPQLQGRGETEGQGGREWGVRETLSQK